MRLGVSGSEEGIHSFVPQTLVSVSRGAMRLEGVG